MRTPLQFNRLYQSLIIESRSSEEIRLKEHLNTHIAELGTTPEAVRSIVYSAIYKGADERSVLNIPIDIKDIKYTMFHADEYIDSALDTMFPRRREDMYLRQISKRWFRLYRNEINPSDVLNYHTFIQAGGNPEDFDSSKMLDI